MTRMQALALMPEMLTLASPPFIGDEQDSLE